VDQVLGQTAQLALHTVHQQPDVRLDCPLQQACLADGHSDIAQSRGYCCSATGSGIRNACGKSRGSGRGIGGVRCTPLPSRCLAQLQPQRPVVFGQLQQLATARPQGCPRRLDLLSVGPPVMGGIVGKGERGGAVSADTMLQRQIGAGQAAASAGDGTKSMAAFTKNAAEGVGARIICIREALYTTDGRRGQK